MAFPGWSWEYVDNFMTIPRLEAIYKYWETQPPIHQMLASYFGISAAPKSSEPVGNFADFAAQLRDSAAIFPPPPPETP